MNVQYPCVISKDCDYPTNIYCTTKGSKQPGIKCKHTLINIDKTCGDSHNEHSGKCSYPYEHLPDHMYSIDEIHNTSYCCDKLVCYGEDTEQEKMIFIVVLVTMIIYAMCCVRSVQKT